MDLDAIFNPDPRAVAGGAALGDMLTGGPGRRAEGAYVDQFQKNAKAADAMWQARDNRARAIAREVIQPDVVQRAMAGDAAAQAQLGAAALGTAPSPNLSNVTGGLGDMADMEIDRQREAALKAHNVPQYNALTQMREHKPYQPARIEDGVITPDGLGLGDEAFTVQPLPQTQSLIDQRAAGTARTRAQIGNDAERTDAYVDKQRRGPAPRAHKAGVDPDTTMAWITAKANDLAKSGKSDDYVQAFIRNEAAKAGITLEGDAPASPASPSSSVEVRPGFVSFDSIPSAARSKLKEGVVTKFGNGQSWSLRNGQPVRVK